jgi:hypothetical protein
MHPGTCEILANLEYHCGGLHYLHLHLIRVTSEQTGDVDNGLIAIILVINWFGNIRTHFKGPKIADDAEIRRIEADLTVTVKGTDNIFLGGLSEKFTFQTAR